MLADRWGLERPGASPRTAPEHHRSPAASGFTASGEKPAGRGEGASAPHLGCLDLAHEVEEGGIFWHCFGPLLHPAAQYSYLCNGPCSPTLAEGRTPPSGPSPRLRPGLLDASTLPGWTRTPGPLSTWTEGSKAGGGGWGAVSLPAFGAWLRALSLPLSPWPGPTF